MSARRPAVKTDARRKPKFKVGQVVCVMGSARLGDPDEYGVVKGYDDGRWHIDVGSRNLKCTEDILRSLTKRERAGASREN
jgi:hypothetical protein